ncbi:DUF896 domain-containing protein [Fusibacter ferrireducens]|uniref:UPF0291 protein ISU02_17080 n=1 Tax=Fusibacter ferrireducens TaxID=2785058 RepID=A0ABR9ZWI6_9FIRM|nr:DUF896 domain-containing protein [Fusibacter ferrireducens]MBF4694817.1 DUF896 domain-containing protein [Fusibacter ferrireducens]
MLSQEKLDRINFLAHKKKTEGLNDEELKEQLELREAYLKAFRSSFKKQLDNIEIVYKD